MWGWQERTEKKLHPLHIWHVWYWLEETKYDEKQVANLQRWKTYIPASETIRKLWKDKRLPLSVEMEDLVDYIYSLLPDNE